MEKSVVGWYVARMGRGKVYTGFVGEIWEEETTWKAQA
jgi:hypothetical protein